MTAILVTDHGYPLHLVRHLNRLQVARIFLRERHEDGRVKVRPKLDFGPNPRDEFYDRRRARGMPKHQIDRLWRMLEDQRRAEVAAAKAKRK